ncbi:c6 transcription factor [Diaporthe amygdali]|uniref:c6 transcription factor n=1 Tax=Phomopsis amygdali TaxID=1214568 RepID=UPI0022FDD864|nr:c6 transcription factor [Diaporthe amygdali]KAJ0108827.1 c6 transcription factor [Diaporthe amygdali]
MTLEERAELEQLRQQHELPRKVPGHGGDDGDILHRLKTLPEDEAVALFIQLRSGARVNDNVVTARSIPAPSRTSLEFELIHRHPILYPVVTAAESPEIEVSGLRVLPYQEHESESTGSRKPSSTRRPSSLRSSPTKAGFRRPSSPEPSVPLELCDERLKHIRIRNWTQISISNQLAASLISFYLTVDHPILGLFDADLFLGDLVAHKTEFCSPLLLSAVLCFACQGYSNIEAETAVLSYAFFTEAERLHREESTGNPQYQFAIPNIAATQLLSLAATCHGRNELALRYLVEGIELAHQNGLLAVGKMHSARNWLDDHVDFVKAASHTAWGTFCRATLLGMNYQYAYIDIPSWLPIPGTTIVRADGGSEPFELPGYMGQSFTELCRLTPLINEMLHDYYDSGDGVAPTNRASFSFAQGLYRRMLEWADSLPVTMARGDGMPHHAAIVHIYFHTAVLDLFRPFPYQRPETPFRLDGFDTDEPTPEGLCNASVNQLKHLILVFRSRYPCATYSMLWQNALLYIANACLPLQRTVPSLQAQPDGTTDERAAGPRKGVIDDEGSADEREESEEDDDMDRRKWFMACVDALRALAPQFGIVTGIVQGILSMAILKGFMAAVDGRAIMDQLKAETELSRQHRREHFARSQGGAMPATAAAAEFTDGQVDGQVDGVETTSRVTYGSSGGQLSAGSGPYLRGLANLPGAQAGGNGFVIDLNEASVNPSAASLDVLARAFDELAMFDEFTTGEDGAER